MLKDLVLRKDFEALEEGDRVVLYPNDANDLHKEPVAAYFNGNFFFCNGSPPEEGPDYGLKDARNFLRGFTLDQ